MLWSDIRLKDAACRATTSNLGNDLGKPQEQAMGNATARRIRNCRPTSLLKLDEVGAPCCTHQTQTSTSR